MIYNMMSIAKRVTCVVIALALLSAPSANGQAIPGLGDAIADIDLGTIPTGPVSGVRATLISDVSGPSSLTQLALAPGFNDMLYFTERSGPIYQVDLTNPDPFSNFTQVGNVASVLGGRFGDGRGADIPAGDGMRGLAFHPDFATAGTAGFGKLYTIHEEVFGSGTPTFAAPVPGDLGGRQDSVVTE